MNSSQATRRQSGIPWVDDLPAHWDVRPLLAVARERIEPNEGMRETNLLSLSYGRIVPKDITSNDGLLPETFETYQIVEAGDVVLRLTDLQNDKRSLRSGLVATRGIITSAYVAVAPLAIEPSFLSYLLRAYDLTKVFYSMGGGLRQSMKYGDVRRLPIIVPPLPEQTAIAAFLDRETGKIDALVEEQRRLIELLKEKRQAVISHAVTKGLDPNARMKPSGVEWLGDVPEHWAVRRLKALIQPGTSISYGIVQPGEPQDHGVPFIQTTNMSSGSFEVEQLQRTTADIASAYPRSRLRGGEVILGIRASIGAAHVVPEELAGANLSRGVARIECGVQISNSFLVACLSGHATSQYWALSKQGSTFNEVSIETVRELAIAVPPMLEQSQIVEFLRLRSHRLDTLVEQAERAVLLLAERRSALISAAVTGKIDMRGERQENEAA